VREAYIRQYRDFWDFPRIFLVSFEQSLFLFDCTFNQEIEEFRSEYQVFLMPELDDKDLGGSWNQLSEKSIRLLGKVPVNDVAFDDTRRRFIDADAILKLLKVLAYDKALKR
jgi:hypothetical protein